MLKCSTLKYSTSRVKEVLKGNIHLPLVIMVLEHRLSTLEGCPFEVLMKSQHERPGFKDWSQKICFENPYMKFQYEGPKFKDRTRKYVLGTLI